MEINNRLRQKGSVLVLLLLLFLVVFPVFGEGVEQVVNDLGAEDPYTQTVSHLLRVSFNLHIERQYHCVPAADKGKERNSW